MLKTALPSVKSLRPRKAAHLNMSHLIPFFDPHFHVWDVTAVHSLDTLGKPAQVYPSYSLVDYERDIEQNAPWLRHIGGCIVEALPANDDTIAELKWIQQHLSSYEDSFPAGNGKLYCTIARINLTEPSAPAVLAEMSSMAGVSSKRMGIGLGVVGVRQILNFEPSWPYVNSNLLLDADFVASFSAFANTGKPFDLHVNPHQLRDAATKLVAEYKSTAFVLNHMACLRGAVDSFEDWCKDVAYLATFPNVFVKLSGFEYPDENWSSKPLVASMFQTILTLFGSSRCMVASNFPVTSTLGAPPRQLFTFLQTLVKALPEEAVHDIMWRTALRVYCPQVETPHCVLP